MCRRFSTTPPNCFCSYLPLSQFQYQHFPSFFHRQLYRGQIYCRVFKPQPVPFKAVKFFSWNQDWYFLYGWSQERMPSNSQQRRHSNLLFSPQCPAGLPAIEAVNQNPNNLNFYSLYLPRYPRPPPSATQLPPVTSASYLIFVIFFTQTKFLENKIYTEKTRKLRQNTQRIANCGCAYYQVILNVSTTMQRSIPHICHFFYTSKIFGE